MVHPNDPNTVYIGGAQGGVWKTTDGGETWQPLTDQQSTLAVGSMAFAPNDPNTIYVGTGEPHNSADSYYGDGLLKTVDGGATWTALGQSTFTGMGISNVVVWPDDPNRIYVAASGSVAGLKPTSVLPGIFRSTDGGGTWQAVAQVYGETTYPSSPSSLVISTDNKLYATFDYEGLYVSSDGGETWSQIFDPQFYTKIKIE